MSGEMQIRARMTGGDVVDVKILIAHVMETGTRKDPKTKNLIGLKQTWLRVAAFRRTSACLRPQHQNSILSRRLG